MLPEKKVEATRGIWSSPRRLRVSPGGHRGGLWPSRVRRTGSRWWLWYLPKCPPDPEREKVLGGLRIGRILTTGVGGNLGYIGISENAFFQGGRVNRLRCLEEHVNGEMPVWLT